jgi:predicted dehydrogenase
MDLPRDVYYKKELDLRLSMSYGPGRYDAEYEERGNDYPFAYVRWTEQRNMQTILELIASGSLDIGSLITHRFPFEKALETYDMILAGKEPFLGIILEYDEPDDQGKIVLKESTTDPAGKVGLGVIGAGNFAKGVLLPRFKKMSQVGLKGIVTARGMSAKDVGSQFGFGYCADENSTLYNDEKINTILIATRHNLHGNEVKNALAAGKHVFVEKPLCLNAAELQDIVRIYTDKAEQKNAPVIMVGFNRRFSPFIQKIKGVLDSKVTPIVASYRINAGFIPKDSWVQDIDEGGGRIVGEVCHFVDLLKYLVAAPVRTVHASSVQSRDQTVTDRDSVSITLTYDDGSLANILYHAFGNADYPKEVLEIAVDNKTIVMNDFRRLEIFDKKRAKSKSAQNKGFDEEIKAFVEAVEKGGGSPISFNEIVETTLVTFAVHKSLDTGTLINLKDFGTKLDISF